MNPPSASTQSLFRKQSKSTFPRIRGRKTFASSTSSASPRPPFPYAQPADFPPAGQCTPPEVCLNLANAYILLFSPAGFASSCQVVAGPRYVSPGLSRRPGSFFADARPCVLPAPALDLNRRASLVSATPPQPFNTSFQPSLIFYTAVPFTQPRRRARKTDGRTRHLPRPRRSPDADRHPVLRVLALVRPSGPMRRAG